VIRGCVQASRRQTSASSATSAVTDLTESTNLDLGLSYASRHNICIARPSIL